jgi:hypothetical protein
MRHRFFRANLTLHQPGHPRGTQRKAWLFTRSAAPPSAPRLPGVKRGSARTTAVPRRVASVSMTGSAGKEH